MGMFYSRANSVGKGMNNVKRLLLAISILMVFSGCSSSVPDCSDSETTDLVFQIATQDLKKFIKPDARKYTDIHTIITTNTDEKTGFHECKAELEMSYVGTEMKQSVPITYKVEQTDKGELYVTVRGL